MAETQPRSEPEVRFTAQRLALTLSGMYRALTPSEREEIGVGFVEQRLLRNALAKDFMGEKLNEAETGAIANARKLIPDTTESPQAHQGNHGHRTRPVLPR